MYASSDLPRIAAKEEGTVLTEPRIHDIDVSCLDAHTSGLDTNVLKYRFERLMLLDICKSNAGRCKSTRFMLLIFSPLLCVIVAVARPAAAGHV